MKTMPDLKPIMTTQEVARALGVTDAEIRRLERAGVLKRLRGYNYPMKFAGHTVKTWLEGAK